MLTTFEALRAYAESRNVAVASVRDVVRVARVLSGGPRRLRDLPKADRRVVALLWHLGLAVAHLKLGGGSSLWVSPTSLLSRIAGGELAPLTVRLARWVPMRLLLRYMAARGGAATVDDVERDLGSEVLETTRAFLRVLKFAYPRLRGPVRKPYNRHVVSAVLFRLGAELGLLVKRGDEAEMTELAYELLGEPRVEVVKTMPKAPLVLMAVASVVGSSRRVFLASPWV